MLAGNYLFENVASRYGNNKALEVKQLRINAGEKIGVLGPIGGGKTTLLRVLSCKLKTQRSTTFSTSEVCPSRLTSESEVKVFWNILPSQFTKLSASH